VKSEYGVEERTRLNLLVQPDIINFLDHERRQ
jgi:hypothetical protein